MCMESSIIKRKEGKEEGRGRGWEERNRKIKETKERTRGEDWTQQG